MSELENLQIMREFKGGDLPNLDIAVLGALELFESEGLPNFNLPKFRRPFIVGSGNGDVTGRILFKEAHAVFADESDFAQGLNSVSGIDGAVIVSSSGSKSSVHLAKELDKRAIKTFLLTNTANSPASSFIAEENVLLFPKNREPISYNVSTYMGMILAKTKEDPAKILSYLEEMDEFSVQGGPTSGWDFSKYDAFYILVPEEFREISRMFRRKFDELFGSKIAHRVFTPAQTAHGHTIVESEKELFVALGVKNEHFGMAGNRLDIELPEGSNFATIMALGYYLIGKIQGQHPPYFKESIKGYTKRIAGFFGKEVKMIVE